MATMAEGSISTTVILYVLYGLFDSFGEETKSDDYVRNYDDAAELSYETDHDNGSNFIDTWMPMMMN